MSYPLDEMLKDSMKTSLDTFFLSLQKGGTTLSSFLRTWSAFHDSIRVHHNELHQETLVAVQSIASLINNVSTNVLELETSSEKLLNESVTDVSKILEDGLGGLTIHDETKPQPSNAFPPYLEQTYKWLLDNLDNPYPSKDVKKAISHDTKTSLKDIDAWFIDTRKRIGWNKLRKTHFSNKQEKIIAASTRFFKPKSASFTDKLSASLIDELDPDDQYRAEFLAMEAKAKSLYSGRFPALASHNTFDDHLTARSTPKNHVGVESNTSSGQPQPLPTANISISAYPTPEPSPRNYEDSLPSPVALPPLTLDPPCSSKRKRRFSEDTAIDGDNESLPSAQKRSRHDDPKWTEVEAVASLPSPANTDEGVEDAPVTHSVNVFTVQETSPAKTSPAKRKRRLSDADVQGLSKRPHCSQRLARLQTVSDPFPMNQLSVENVFHGWFQDSSASEDRLSDTIPLPANVEEPISLDFPLDVDLYRYDLSPYNPYLSEIFTTPDVVNESVTPPSPSYNVNLSSTFDLSFCNDLRDADYRFIVGADIQFDLVNAPYQPDFQCHQVPDDFPIFPNSELLSLTHGDMPDASLLDNPYSHLNSLDSSPETHVIKTSILGNFNRVVRRALPSSDDREAKRAHARALREELALYEAEGL